jgi:tetratricopeptide (TPR) repeat protein
MASHTTALHLRDRTADLCAEQRFAEAAELLSEALSVGESAELWNDWGATQLALKQPVDAEKAFRRALSLDHDHEVAVSNLGALLFYQERYAEAIPVLRRAVALGESPEYSQLSAILAECEAKAQRGVEETPLAVSAMDTQKEASRAAGSPAIQQAAPDQSYDDWFQSVFQQRVPAPNVRIATNWNEDSEWGRKAHNALVQVECEYVAELLKEIQSREIPGDIAEFGIFQGWWVNHLWQATEQIGLKRRIYGFDSFEGLSEPHPQHDLDFWKKGQYACSLEQVERNVFAAARPRIRLVRGFFEKSLRRPEAQLAEQFCYVRIDCDIYQPALDCLRYLSHRLADGAILVFDDWPHMRGFGEQRAFEEWLPSVPHLEFEFLFYGSIGHFYTRVRHRKN